MENKNNTTTTTTPTQRAPEWLNWFREAELKHGRQAMLATVGLVVPEFVRVPGAQFSFDAVPNVLDAHDALLDTSMKQILLWVSFAEVCTLAALSNMNEFDRVPGDYGFDPLGAYPTDPAKQKEMKMKELKNGRLVSFCMGFIFRIPRVRLYITYLPKGFALFLTTRAMNPPPFQTHKNEKTGNGRNRRHGRRILHYGTRIPVPIKT